MADTAQYMSAATRVFATPELLEAILLEVWETRPWSMEWQAREVLLSQRVNRAFRSCIVGSPEIQRRLGFKPDIIRAPVPIVAHLGAPLMYYLVYEALSKLAGLEAVRFYDAPDRDSVEESPHPTLLFRRVQRMYDLRMALKDNPASFLKMYLQNPMSEHVIIEVRQSVPPRSLELRWRSAQVTVKVQSFGVLVKLALSLQEAADEIARMEEAKNWWNVKSENVMAYNVPEANVVFDWRKFFSPEEIEMVVGKPEYDIA